MIIFDKIQIKIFGQIANKSNKAKKQQECKINCITNLYGKGMSNALQPLIQYQKHLKGVLGASIGAWGPRLDHAMNDQNPLWCRLKMGQGPFFPSPLVLRPKELFLFGKPLPIQFWRTQFHSNHMQQKFHNRALVGLVVTNPSRI